MRVRHPFVRAIRKCITERLTMQRETEKDNKRDQALQPVPRYRNEYRHTRHHQVLFFLILISIALCGRNELYGETPNMRGVQIDLEGGNRICISFEGKIKSIIVKGSVNLPGKTFENITKVGNTKIYRNHSGKVTRIGHAGISRDWRGNIIKIGNAKVLRDNDGGIIAVNGDPTVSPLFAIYPP